MLKQNYIPQIFIVMLITFGLVIFSTTVQAFQHNDNTGTNNNRNSSGNPGSSSGSGGSGGSGGGGNLSGNTTVSVSPNGSVSITQTISTSNVTTVNTATISCSGGSCTTTSSSYSYGGGPNNNGTTPTTGPGSTAPCLPDLRVSSLQFVDGSGNVYSPSSVPANTVLTPKVSVTNNTVCATNLASSYSWWHNGGNNPGWRTRNYQTWRNAAGYTNGSYPIRFAATNLSRVNVVSSGGPTIGRDTTVVTVPTITFPNVGTEPITMTADDVATCGVSVIQGCIDESIETNNTLTQNVTIVNGATPIAPECSNTNDDDTDTLIDTNDPGCHTDGDPTNPGTYDPNDNDESDPTVSCWVQNPAATANTCNNICGTGGGYSSVTAGGAQCLSGESRPNEALTIFGTVANLFRWGCWPKGSCQTANSAKNATAGTACYYPGQKRDGDPTDRIVGCYCDAITTASVCTGSPTTAAQGPTITLSLTTDGGTTYQPSPGPISLSPAEATVMEVRWDVVSTGTGLDCDGTSDFTQVVNAGAPGQQLVVASARPTAGGPTKNYGVTCTDSNGTGSDSIAALIPAAPSNVTLDVKKTTQGTWTTNAATVPFIISTPDNTIDLQWGSIGATACLGNTVNGPGGSSAGNFSTNGLTTGTVNANSPDIGNYALYSVNCSSLGGNQSQQVEVQRPAPAPILTIIDPSTGQPATLVDIGTTVHISWDTNGNDFTQCSLTGPNWTVNNPLPSATGTNLPIVIQGESDFILDCAANTISPTTGLPINPAANVTKKVKVTSDFTES